MVWEGLAATTSVFRKKEGPNMIPDKPAPEIRALLRRSIHVLVLGVKSKSLSFRVGSLARNEAFFA
jgi:hypothetical protein